MNPRTPGCRSDFVWDRVAEHVVAVIDCNVGGTAVTNDADNVVAFLLTNEHAQSDDIIIYRDSLGTWDKLAHNGRCFLGFCAIGATDLRHALQRLRGE